MKPSWLNALCDLDGCMPRELRAEIICDASAPENLVSILENYKSDVEEKDSEFVAMLHALDLLSIICPPELVERVVRVGEASGALHGVVIDKLQSLGNAAVDPCLRLQRDSNIAIRAYACAVLSGLGIRDERIYSALTTLTADNGFLGGDLLLEYGDPRSAAFLENLIERTLQREDSDDDESLESIICDFVKLGGVLSVEAERFRERHDVQHRLEREVAVRFGAPDNEERGERVTKMFEAQRKEKCELWRRFEEFAGSLPKARRDDVGMLMWKLARVADVRARNRAVETTSKRYGIALQALRKMIPRHRELFPELYGADILPEQLPQLNGNEGSRAGVDWMLREYVPVARALVEKSGRPNDVVVVLDLSLLTGEVRVVAPTREEAKDLFLSIALEKESLKLIIDDIETMPGPLVAVLVRSPHRAALLKVQRLDARAVNDGAVFVRNIFHFEPASRREILRRLVRIENLERRDYSTGPFTSFALNLFGDSSVLELWSTELHLTSKSQEVCEHATTKIRLVCGALITRSEPGISRAEVLDDLRHHELQPELEACMQMAASELCAVAPWKSEPHAKSVRATVVPIGLDKSTGVLRYGGERGFEVEAPHFGARLVLEIDADGSAKPYSIHRTEGRQLPAPSEICVLTAIASAIAQAARDGEWNVNLVRWCEAQTHNGPRAVRLDRLTATKS